jgi:LysM repeat protein
MTRKFFNLMMVVILVAGFTVSCSKPASVASQVTPTSLGELPFPLATQPNIMNEILFGTQTAEAMAHQLPVTDATLESTLIVDLSAITTPLVATTPAPATQTPGIGTPSVTPAPLTLSTTAAGTPGLVATTGTKVAIAYATSTPGVPESYTIHKGEFPYCLARRFNVSAGDILNLNGLGANTQVSEGTVIKIPQSSSWTSGDRALKSHPTTYTVSTGDTIYTIACEYGDVDPNIIISANGLVSPYTLTSGTTLQIP